MIGLTGLTGQPRIRLYHCVPRQGGAAGTFHSFPSSRVRPQVIPRIDFRASDAVRAVLSAIGRTEDVRFSPDNRLLAIAGFGRKRCLILRIEVEPASDGPEVTIHDYMELTSDCIGEVHGLDFIDDRTLAVANRDGLVGIFSLPAGEPAGRSLEISPRRQIKSGLFCKLSTPGSIAVRRESQPDQPAGLQQLYAPGHPACRRPAAGISRAEEPGAAETGPRYSRRHRAQP